MASTSAEVRIIGFRGVGNDPRYIGESGLIKAGHVGISIDGGHTIFGFRPTSEAIATFSSPEAAFAHLRARYDLPGGVYDDTVTFWRAAQLAQTGARTAVWQSIIRVSVIEADRIFYKLQQAISAGSALGALYRYPNKRGAEMPPGVNNCATWSRELGIPILEPTGRLRQYVALLQARGERWP